MNEPIRSDRPPSGESADRDRDARIEELLLTGLDHYFSGHHELAINIWTRVLFLDRGHAKARAYIERARGAIAEKQREAEELLHSGAAALDRGDHVEARELLSSAVEHGTSGEEALALLHRLDRLEAAAEPSSYRVRQVDSPPPHRPGRDDLSGRRDARVAWVAGGLVTGILIASVVGGYLWMVADSFELEVVRSAPPVVAEEPLPVLAACEMRLVRAEQLRQQGRLREALAVLDPGDPDRRHQARYDLARGVIQRQLIEDGRRNAGFPTVDDRGTSRSSNQPTARSASRK
jgi:hypothetical protein